MTKKKLPVRFTGQHFTIDKVLIKDAIRQANISNQDTVLDIGARVDKIRMELPEEVEGVIHCKNPRCITNDQKVEEHKFYLVNRETKEYRCEYCDSITQFEEI